MKKAMVFGAGKSGVSAQKLLEKSGYEVIIVDDKTGIKSEDAVKLLENVGLFIKSPGVPYVNLIKKAIEKNIEVIDETELSYRELKKKYPKTKVISITGTNGKTTTTAKTAEMLNYCGIKAIACGNIGKPLGDVVLEESQYDYVVLELSSYQLENLIFFKTDIAAVINMTPDHIERYNSTEEYYNTKMNIGINQSFSDTFFINLDDANIRKRVDKITGEILGITSKNDKEGYLFIEKNSIMFKDELIIKTDELSLKGKHNIENMLFVAAIGKKIGIANEKIKEYLSIAKPIEHRLETFLVLENTKFINDSKGTNTDSTKVAIETYPESIIICGGKDKGLDLTGLGQLIAENNMKAVYLIGENRKKIIEALEKVQFSKEKIYDLESIEECAKHLKNNLNLKEENNIVFSPGTSSFDQFENYEDRGRKFKMIINKYFGG